MGVHLTFREAQALGIPIPPEPAKPKRKKPPPSPHDDGVLKPNASELERTLWVLIRDWTKVVQKHGLPLHDEHKVDGTGDRDWRYDFAWPDLMFAIEVQGGQWTQGRHSRGGNAYRDELCKLRTATVSGWWVLMFTTDDIVKKSFQAGTVAEIEMAMQIRAMEFRRDGRSQQ